MSDDKPVIPPIINAISGQGAPLTGDTQATFNAALGAGRSATGLGANATGNDPDYIEVMEDFGSLAHADIYAKAQQMQPGVMHQSADGWKDIATALTGNMIGFSAKVNKTLARSWQGQTADAISAAVRTMTGELTAIQNVVQGVGYRMESAAYGAEVVKAAVPPVPSNNPSGVLGVTEPSAGVNAAKTSLDTEQAAQWVLRNNYQPTYEPAGQGVPVFTTASALGDGTGVPGSSVPGGANSPNSPGTGQNPGISGDGAAVQPGGSGAGGDTQTTGQSQATDTGSGDSGAGDSSTDGTDTTAASTDTTGSGSPSTTGSPGSGQPGGGQPNAGAAQPGSGSPSAGSPGVGRPGSGVPGSGGTAGGPGRSVSGLGTGGRAGAAAAGTGTAGGGRAAAGAHGMPGYGAPGGARKSEEDTARGRPELLIHPRNRIDLIGPTVGTVPPVIGAEVDQPLDDRQEDRG